MPGNQDVRFNYGCNDGVNVEVFVLNGVPEGINVRVKALVNGGVDEGVNEIVKAGTTFPVL